MLQYDHCQVILSCSIIIRVGGVFMLHISYCVYCGKVITETSKEHIIQNALGGLYESTGICCPDCNNLISRFVDVPFTKIFNPIISQIVNFAKTNKEKSSPPCTGKARYNGVVYDVGIKNGKVSSCPVLSKELKGDIKKLDWTILSYDFNIENDPFKNGLGKIAFNYALECGIRLDDLSHGLCVQKTDGTPTSITFSFPVLPFVALNPMDNYLELETEMQLYHNLILFSQRGSLWCYVDLFNTFQYYVLLSDHWNDEEKVYHSYLQLVQKLDRTVPKVRLRRQKHALIYADLYNVAPTTDVVELQKRVSEAILKESLKKDMVGVISKKLGINYVLALAEKEKDSDEFELHRNSFALYFDEESRLRPDTFRQVTFCNKAFEITSYPWFLNQLYTDGVVDPTKYIHAKFYRLNQFLLDSKLPPNVTNT